MTKSMRMSQLLISIVLMGLTACQHLPQSTLSSLFNQHWIAPVAQPVGQQKQLAKIYCSGVSSCEFTRLNDVHLIDPKTGWLTPEALNLGIIRMQGSSFSENKRLPFYLSVPAQSHEIAINFFPISKEKAEKFVVIHEFKAGNQYTFHMYRQREKQGSLLAVSAPDPLCIELLQNQIAIKRFCRAHDALTGLGEFVEQDVK